MGFTRGRAPYQAGDTITLLHDNRHGRVVTDLPIRAVVSLTDGRWRVEAERELGCAPMVHVIVRADGFDDHGYVIPAVTP